MKIDLKIIKFNLNDKEYLHYLVGGLLLAIAFVGIMGFVKNSYLATVIWIMLAYPIIDQIMHVVIKGESMNLFKR